VTPAEAEERAARVAAIVSVPCGVCHVPAGETCAVGDVLAWRLDRAGMTAHLSRMMRAVRLGRIEHDDLVAQFGDNVPPELVRL
jgi:hypothetical protein